MKYYRMLLKKPLRDFVRMSSDVFMDGRKVKCAHVQNEAPTIVFENGFCSGVSCMKYWDEVFISLAKEYTLFAYDRVDTVIENEVLEDTENHLDDTVDLVKKLLQAKGLESPYILVGHSLGGLYMQYFAKKYAHEVRGIVLVDAVYPNGQLQGHVLDDNIAKIGKHILQMPKKLDIPIVVLSATQEALKST
ncbi:alpha/beta hydrolase, partial [Sulfurovum sp.]